MVSLEGITIVHYHLQNKLACGGMSEIYLAQDLDTHNLVAMKIVDSNDFEYRQRFHNEVRTQAKLKHDNILPVFDHGEYGPWCYMVMPYITYGTLRQRLAEGPLDFKEAGQILTQLVNALQFAHDHNILHRDIKPSNILLHDGIHVYLADFGLGKHLEQNSHITQTGAIVGTPAYMAPELVEYPATKYSDIYALGVVLYQMLTGQVPFKGSSPLGTCWKHKYEQPRLPSSLNPTVPETIDTIILRALAKEPHDRFASAQELAQAYQAALRYTSTEIQQSQSATLYLQPFTRQRKKLQKFAVTCMTLLCLCIAPAFMGFFLYYSSYHAHIPTRLVSDLPFQGRRPPNLPPTLLKIEPTNLNNVTPTVRSSNKHITSGTHPTHKGSRKQDNSSGDDTSEHDGVKQDHGHNKNKD
jgi:serine/threonine protein kinase